jgi:ligand-binding SRPBCC domain-containing protein
MIRTLHRQQFVPGDPEHIWNFFATPQNLNVLTPDSLRFRIIGHVAARMYAGQMIEYRIGILPGVWTRWLTETTHVREGEFFVDEQRLGPYRFWHHEHRFEPVENRRGLLMTDHITYDVGYSFLGGLMETLWIRGQLAEIFDFRRTRINELFPE